MSPAPISKRIVVERLVWVERMVREIHALPLASKEAFFADRRNALAAESCLRRALEGLLDLGRHILAKAFGVPASTYKEIAERCREKAVLTGHDAELLRVLAGYRNRMAHFYHEIGSDELYEICSKQLGDVEKMAEAYRNWIDAHKDLVDESL